MYQEVFKKFSQLEGSQHIASEFALRGIENLIRNKNIKTIFEFGVGIGTIPYLLYKINPDLYYTGTENNNFCVSALNKNLKGIIENERFNQIKDYTEFEGEKVDLVIIDGKFNDVLFLKKICHDKTLIFIEGHRLDQQKFVLTVFPNALLCTKISNKKNKPYSPFYNEIKNPYNGGYSFIRLENNFKNKLKHFINKLKTSLKYKLRIFKKHIYFLGLTKQ